MVAPMDGIVGGMGLRSQGGTLEDGSHEHCCLRNEGVFKDVVLSF